MKKYLGLAFTLTVIASNFSYAADRNVVCVAGRFAKDGALASLGGAEPSVAILKGNVLTLNSFLPSEDGYKDVFDSVNRSTPFDEKLVNQNGSSTVAVISDSVVSAHWRVQTDGEIQKTAAVNIDLKTLSGTITIHSKGPGVESQLSEEINCTTAGLE